MTSIVGALGGDCRKQMRKLLDDLVEHNKCAGPGPARCSHVDSQQE